MKIRSYLLGTLLFMIAFWVSAFAFEPNQQQQEELASFKGQIAPLVEKDNYALWNFYEQARDLHLYFKEEKTAYYLEHLRDFFLTKFLTRKDLAKSESSSLKSDFLSQYQGSGLEASEVLSQNCIGWYQTLDNLSFAYDFPTALTIAVRYRESWCGFYLPKNGDGPFQIVSKDYGNWTISKELFEKTIKDFLEFSKKKIDWYNGKNPSTPITLSYKSVNYDDLLKFSGLYNGLSWWIVYGNILPAVPKYFFEKMPWEYEKGKRNWLFLQFLRVLEWEIKQ